MNVSETLLLNGFSEVFQSQWGKFNPNDNWFGVSLYHPDAKFKNGNKEVELSVQGMLTPSIEEECINFNTDRKDITNDEEQNIMVLIKKRAIRYVAFKQAGKVLYYSLTGQLPSQDFIQDFIKS